MSEESAKCRMPGCGGDVSRREVAQLEIIGPDYEEDVLTLHLYSCSQCRVVYADLPPEEKEDDSTENISLTGLDAEEFTEDPLSFVDDENTNDERE